MANAQLAARLARLEAQAARPGGLQPIRFVHVVIPDGCEWPDPATLPESRPGCIEFRYISQAEAAAAEAGRVIIPDNGRADYKNLSTDVQKNQATT